MELRDSSPTKKALQINLDDSIYGTFAEIGAGQEVARYFFQAGRASHTIAKTISAYDMTFSDEIYGKIGRYVCEPRVLKMLEHEYDLLMQRLSATRGSKTRFFAFADTVATSSHEDGSPRCHGWMGVRFQTRPGGPANDIILHVKLWDRFRLQQQEALGILGVNLIHLAYFPPQDIYQGINALLEHLGSKRVEVNMLRFSGPDFQHIDNRLISLELVRSSSTDAVLFSKAGEVLHASDLLFKKPVFVLRGTFRPVTKINVEILERGLQQMRKHPLCQGDPMVLFEITMNDLVEGGKIDHEDFLHRVDTLGALGHQVLVTNLHLFYQLKTYLRQCTNELIGMVVGAAHLEKLFEKKYYQTLPGGTLEALSRLFDDKTRLFVFPYKQQNKLLTAQNFDPGNKQTHLHKYLLDNELMLDLLDCEDVDTTTHSKAVRDLLASGNPQWEQLVPQSVCQLIKDRQLFGYRPQKRRASG